MSSDAKLLCIWLPEGSQCCGLRLQRTLMMRMMPYLALRKLERSRGGGCTPFEILGGMPEWLQCIGCDCPGVWNLQTDPGGRRGWLPPFVYNVLPSVAAILAAIFKILETADLSQFLYRGASGSGCSASFTATNIDVCTCAAFVCLCAHH